MIRVGASGVLHPGMSAVWPADRGPDFDSLEFAARWFGAIEVGATEYAVPKAAHVARWARAVAANERSRLVLPIPRDLEPFGREREEIAASVGELRDALAPIMRRERLAAVTLRLDDGRLFGPTEIRALATFARAIPGAPLVLEATHASWHALGAHAAIRGAGWNVGGGQGADSTVRLLRLAAPGRAEPSVVGELARHAARLDRPGTTTLVLASNAKPPDVPPSIALATAVELKYVLAGERPVPVWPELVAAHPYLEPLTTIESRP